MCRPRSWGSAWGLRLGRIALATILPSCISEGLHGDGGVAARARRHGGRRVPGGGRTARLARGDGPDAVCLSVERVDLLAARTQPARGAPDSPPRRATVLAGVLRRAVLRPRQPVDAGQRATAPARHGAHQRTSGRLSRRARRTDAQPVHQRTDAAARPPTHAGQHCARPGRHGVQLDIDASAGHALLQRRGDPLLRTSDAPPQPLAVAGADLGVAARECSSCSVATTSAACCAVGQPASYGGRQSRDRGLCAGRRAAHMARRMPDRTRRAGAPTALGWCGGVVDARCGQSTRSAVADAVSRIGGRHPADAAVHVPAGQPVRSHREARGCASGRCD